MIFLFIFLFEFIFFFFSSRRRHTRLTCDWSSDVCSSDLSCKSSRKNRTARRPTFGAWTRRRGGGTCRRRAGASSRRDRKSTRLNSSHMSISYAVFCLQKKTNRSHPGHGSGLGVPAVAFAG